VSGGADRHLSGSARTAGGGARRVLGGGQRPAPGSRLAARRAAELLIQRHSASLLATARRYTVSPEDAEDAYQRGLEILLTKAPAVTDEELLPWTRTVIKHEAFAIWRSRDRAVAAPDDEPLEQAASAAPSPDEQVERLERLRLSAEAIGRLKPQEVRCLVLRAEGHSYRQICRITGFTYTKVNRCLAEGRQSFLRRVAGIESGAECNRLAPLLSALADGEATGSDMATLRPHLRSCLACRAALRAYRELPHRAAEVVPLAGGAAAEEGPAAVWRWTESAIAWMQERVGLMGAKAQAATEAASASKVAAVAASTAALAGGTMAVRSLEGPPAGAAPPGPDRAERVLERAAPANLLPALPDEPVPAVPEEIATPAPVEPPELVNPAPPVPAPDPAAEPPVTEPQPIEPAPEFFPSNGTVAVTESGKEGAFGDVDEEERQLDPMTTPIKRPARRSNTTVPPDAGPTAGEEQPR
jgi:RNA polymerase sigma factor (sigma-70 family)